jgi:predicted helicase
MKRYAITTYKESGIKNDPKDWVVEKDCKRIKSILTRRTK